MPLRDAIAWTAEAPSLETLDHFRRHIDPDWIDAALAATGTASLRRRRLPAEQVIWLVLGMALMRDRSIAEVAESLDLALPSGTGLGVTPSAVAQAKDRVGDEPLEWLFRTCAKTWAHASAANHRWRGLAIYGVDGTTHRVPDSPENRLHFTVPHDGTSREAGYPQLRLATLMALRSHVIAAAEFGPSSIGEVTLAAKLWSELPDASLCIVDRGFFGAAALLAITRGGESRHWLTRAKSSLKWDVVRQLGKGDLLIEMKVSAPARRKDPTLPERWQARAVLQPSRGARKKWLLTSLLDARTFPAAEIVALYHDRWEIELAYDELKTEVLDREEALRSRSPMRVRQEVWGILLAFNLIRLEMERAAEEAGVAPTRISFIAALHLIRDEWRMSAFASPGAIPRHLRKLRERLLRFLLPPRREHRSYPRTVKVRTARYPTKRRPTDSGGLK